MNLYKRLSPTISRSHLSSAIAVSAVLSSTLVAPALSYAQDGDVSENRDLVELEEVLVTGSRTGRTLDKIPGSVSVINTEDIEREMAVTSDFTAMLAKTIPGMSESKQQLDRRGEKLRGRDALRLLDGVPQGSPLRDGSRNSVFTDMGIIERVEVINGPSASEGIGAAGGIINYITKTPTEMGTEVQISVQGRSQFETDSGSWRTGFNILHKNEMYDLLVATSTSETGISYDGSGKTIAIGTSGSDRDSKSNNLFIKVGSDFGEDDSKRLELSHSRFLIECQCNYSILIEDPEFGYHTNNKIPIKSVKESPLGSKGSFNDFVQTTLTYTDDDLFGGSLFVQYYGADQAMRFEAERNLGKQEPEFAPFTLDEDGFPVGELPLVEQSEISSKKTGLRSAWGTKNLFGFDGFGLEIGADYVQDTAEQRLAIQDRSWVPPMEYTSFAPFAQASYDIGDWSFTAGVRNEDGKLDVDSYVSSWANDRRPVKGGTINYDEMLLNAGAIWQIADQWSIFTSYSEGFSLPNAGIPLRNASCSNDTPESGDPSDPENFPFGGTQPDGCPNDPLISVNEILALDAIVIDSKEVGFSWATGEGQFSASLYENNSDFGTSLEVDPSTGKLMLSRKPQVIQGFEFSGSYNVTDTLNLSAIFSHTTGETTGPEGNLDEELGIFDVPTDKLVVTGDWQYSGKGNIIVSSTTMFDRDINEGKPSEQNIEGYTLFDLTTSYEVGDGTLTLGINNLANKTYMLTTSQVLFWRNYTRGMGREVSLGYTLTF
ncbi:TonB-dependent receptor [Marinimicrobium koreense]|jgi:iron complex outermembrane receptor protein|uniref:TonB-dependent receptor n=1 Tax=Marinimicrobium koreense TaxID=306545 RepID=UPI003F7174EA|tara:strand:+ start:1370 stop:3682 length:2313 start_codon:yes stop_codon:yes gene_type:complete